MPIDTKTILSRRPVMVVSLGLYGAFCLLTLFGLFLHEALLMPAVFVWPYPFLLAVQRFVPDPAGWLEWLVALMLGFVLIGTVANVVDRRLGPGSRLMALAPVLGIIAIVVPLGGLTVLGYAAAIAFGWPLGE